MAGADGDTASAEGGDRGGACRGGGGGPEDSKEVPEKNVDDLGFRWFVWAKGSLSATSEGSAHVRVGDAVWVRLSGGRGCHGTVESIASSSFRSSSSPGGAEASPVPTPLPPTKEAPSMAESPASREEEELPAGRRLGRRRLHVDGKGRSCADVVVRIDEGTEVACGRDRLTRLLPEAPGASPCVVVTADTASFRQLARRQVTAQDRIVEIGSSLGLCTTILHAQAASCVGFDVSLEHLAEARRRFPDIDFQFLDLLEEPDRLRDLPKAAGCTVAFVDIGGDREISQVVHAVELLRRHCLPHLRLIVVKSEELHAAMRKWECEAHAAGVPQLRSPCNFLETWRHLRDPREPLPRGQESGNQGKGSGYNISALQRKKKRNLVSKQIPIQAVKGDGVLALGTLRTSLPKCELVHSGFFLAGAGVREAALCLVCDLEDQVFIQDEGVACVFGHLGMAERIARAASHGVNVFMGRGGQRSAAYRFAGVYRSREAPLPVGCPLRQDDRLHKLVRTLEERSRRARAPEVQLLQLSALEQDETALAQRQMEAPTVEVWMEIARERAAAAAAAAAVLVAPRASG